MKQLGLSLTLYAQDYDETFPAGRGQGGGFPYYTAGWAGQVWPYVKNKAVFACPNDPSQATDWQTGAVLPNFQIISYGLNDSIMGDQNAGSGAPVAAFNRPASTVMLCETQNNWVDPSDYAQDLFSPGVTGDSWFWGGKPSPGGGLDKYATGPLPGQNIVTLKEGRHSRGSNYLAADGHVKFLLGSRVSGGKDAYNDEPAQAQRFPGVAGRACSQWDRCAAGTDSMNNGNGPNAATMTFSKK